MAISMQFQLSVGVLLRSMHLKSVSVHCADHDDHVFPREGQKSDPVKRSALARQRTQTLEFREEKRSCSGLCELMSSMARLLHRSGVCLCICICSVYWCVD